MNRADAITYLTNEFTELATEVQFTSQQTSEAYGVAIDMSLRQLGFIEDDLATADVQTNILGYYALLNYYALKRFARFLAIRVDVNIAGSLQAMRSQAAKQVKALLDDAKLEVMAYGFQVEAPSFQLGRVELDYLEPSTQGNEFAWLF